MAFRVTRQHKKAGIVDACRFPNTNGSYTCLVQLNSINLENTRTNFRKYDKRHMQEMSGRQFHQPSVRNPILLYRNGWTKLATVDGRHTVYLLDDKNTGGRFDTITADVFLNLKDKEAAKVFHNLTQNSKRMDPWSAFHAAKFAEYKFALKIWEVIQAAKFTTPIDNGIPPSSINKPDLTSIEPFIEAYHRSELQGGQLVKDLARLIAGFRYNSKLPKKAGESHFLRGLIDLRLSHQDQKISYLAEALQRYSPEDYVRQAAVYAGECTRRPDRSHFKRAFENMTHLGYRLAA